MRQPRADWLEHMSNELNGCQVETRLLAMGTFLVFFDNETKLPADDKGSAGRTGHGRLGRLTEGRDQSCEARCAGLCVAF
jgi:hypothetical protein